MCKRTVTISYTQCTVFVIPCCSNAQNRAIKFCCEKTAGPQVSKTMGLVPNGSRLTREDWHDGHHRLLENAIFS